MDLHPPCSGMPLAGAVLLIVGELVWLVPRLRSSQQVLRVTAVVFSFCAVLCAFLSGYQASDHAGDLHEAVEAAMATHHALGRLLLINSILLGTFFFISRIAVHGKRVLLALYYVTLLAQVSLTVWVGHLGGDLVFEHGVNIERQTGSEKPALP